MAEGLLPHGWSDKKTLKANSKSQNAHNRTISESMVLFKVSVSGIKNYTNWKIKLSVPHI